MVNSSPSLSLAWKSANNFLQLSVVQLPLFLSTSFLYTSAFTSINFRASWKSW
jgi:hypothetical protein